MLAIGVDIKGNIDTSRVDRFWAGAIGVILLLSGLAMIFLQQIKLRPTEGTAGRIDPEITTASREHPADPFLAPYAVGSALVVVLFWAIMLLAGERTQILAVQFEFGLVALLILAAVIRRYFDLRIYVRGVKKVKRPTGLTAGHYGLVPYMLVVGSSIILITVAIYRYAANDAIRTTVVSYFVGLIIYLLLCRVIWEIHEYRALRALDET